MFFEKVRCVRKAMLSILVLLTHLNGLAIRFYTLCMKKNRDFTRSNCLLFGRGSSNTLHWQYKLFKSGLQESCCVGVYF